MSSFDLPSLSKIKYIPQRNRMVAFGAIFDEALVPDAHCSYFSPFVALGSAISISKVALVRRFRKTTKSSCPNMV